MTDQGDTARAHYNATGLTERIRDALVIDMAIGHFPGLDNTLMAVTLYHETFVCLFDATACGVAPPLSLDDYVAVPHILVSLRGEPFEHIDELSSSAGSIGSADFLPPRNGPREQKCA